MIIDIERKYFVEKNKAIYIMQALNMPFVSNYMKFNKDFKKLVTNLITFQ